jgi:hypothetical protein
MKQFNKPMKRFAPEGRLMYTNDTADCALHALCAVFEVDYKTAWAWCEESGRNPNNGTYSYRLPAIVNRRHYGDRPGEGMVEIPDKYGNYIGLTLTAFVQRYPVGRFYVCLHGHAITMIDGEVIDTTTKRRSPGATIRNAWVRRDTWIGKLNDIVGQEIPDF